MLRYCCCAGIAILFCSALASATSVSGATATVGQIDSATATATIQITNVSHQGIDAYVVSSTATFASGKTQFDEHSKDYGPLYKEFGLLDPGHAVEVRIPFTPRPDDPIVRVDSQVVVVIYVDQAAEVVDERAFQHKMDDRQRMANAMQEAVGILQGAAGSPAGSHPAAQTLPRINEALLQAEQKHQDKGVLLSLKGMMQQASGNVAESDVLQQQLTTFQKQAAAFEAYTHVRRIQ